MYTLVAHLTMRLFKSHDHFIERTHDPPAHPHHNLIGVMPINRKLKNRAKMAEEMMITDEMSDTKENLPTERMTMRSSTCLAKKLKKLMDTPKQNPTAMECNLDDLRKRTRSIAAKSPEPALKADNSQDPNLPDGK